MSFLEAEGEEAARRQDKLLRGLSPEKLLQEARRQLQSCNQPTPPNHPR